MRQSWSKEIDLSRFEIGAPQQIEVKNIFQRNSPKSNNNKNVTLRENIQELW